MTDNRILTQLANKLLIKSRRGLPLCLICFGYLTAYSVRHIHYTCANVTPEPLLRVYLSATESQSGKLEDEK